MRSITIFAILITLILAVAAARSPASEFRIEPAFAVSEEYNDNVFLHPIYRVTDYIFRAVPSVHSFYKAPLWDWDVTYVYEYRHYYYGTVEDDNPQRLNLMSTTRIIKDVFFFDVKDDFSTVSLSVTKDYTLLSPVAGQTQQNVLILNPYLVFHPTARTELKTGYAYRDVWYKDPTAIDKKVHAGYADLTQELSARLKMTEMVRYEVTDTSPMDFTQTTFLIGPRYEYQDGSSAWCKIGASKFSGVADEPTRPVWDAGITQRIMPTITLAYETGRIWVDDPTVILRREDRYIASLKRDVERTLFGASLAYREYGTHGYSDERKYSTLVNFSHYVTQKVQGLYSLMIDKYKKFPVEARDTSSIVYLTGIRFDYNANESLTYSIDYRYADSYSGNSYLDNYMNHRIMAEMKMRF